MLSPSRYLRKFSLKELMKYVSKADLFYVMLVNGRIIRSELVIPQSVRIHPRQFLHETTETKVYSKLPKHQTTKRRQVFRLVKVLVADKFRRVENTTKTHTFELFSLRRNRNNHHVAMEYFQLRRIGRHVRI